MSEKILNEISQKTLASYIEKSSKRLQDKKDKDSVKPLKGSNASVTKTVDNKASDIQKKLKDSGKSSDFIKPFTKKPETTKYTFKGQQWVSDKGKIADKETGANLSKQNIANTGGHNKASERLKSIQQASKRIQDKNYQRQDKINSAKTKLKKFVARVGSEVEKRTERDMPKLKKLGSDIKTGAKNVYKTLKPHVQNALNKAKDYVKSKSEIAKSDSSILRNKMKDKIQSKNTNIPASNNIQRLPDHETMRKNKENVDKALFAAKTKRKLENKSYEIDIEHKTPFLGRKRKETIKINAQNHFQALNKAGMYAKEGKLKDHKILAHRRIK
ncbi:MAG: hypothetical protein HGA61_05145 [Candidatus Moranbacteria bacterium]|nr:hypothetical protein [Candidatus Moranbacteria bacterium]